MAPNPPFGVTLTYFLAKERPRSATATLEIVDGDARRIRTLDIDRSAGMHRTTWDLRYEPPFTVERPQEGAGGGGPAAGAPRGPFVLPGEYAVRLTVQGNTQEVPVTVKPDPLVAITEAEREALHAARLRAWELQRRLNAAVRALEPAKAQVEAGREAAAEARAPEALLAQAEALAKEVDDLIDRLRGPQGGGFAGAGGGRRGGPRRPSVQQRVNTIAGQIDGVTSVPTAYQRQTLEAAAAELEQALPGVNDVIGTKLPALLRALDEAGVPWSPGRAIR